MAGRGGSGHGRDRRRWWLAGLLLLVACLGTAPGLAQVPQLPAAASGDPAQAPLLTDAGELTPEAATALVARLSDAQVRELLLAQLNAEAERRALGAAAPGMIDAVTGQTALIRQRFADLIGAWPAIPAAFGTAVDRFVDERTTGQLLYAVFGLAVVFGVAGLAEMLARRSFRPARDRLLGSEAESRDLLDRSVYLLGLLALDLAGVLAFALGAVVTFLLFDPVHQPTRALALGLLGAIVGYRAFMLVSRFLLNPTNKRHRMSDMGDADAAFIHGWMRWVGAICTFGFVFLQLIQHLGEPGPEHALMGQLLGLLLVFCVAYPLIHRRAAVTRSLLLLVEPSGPMRRFLAAAAPILTALAVIAIFLVYLMTGLMGAPLPPAPGLLTIIVMLIVPYVDTVLERTVVYRRRQQEAADTGSGAVTTVVIRAVRILIWLGSLLLLANAWSVDLRAAASAGVGDTVSDALVDIGFAWFLAYLGWELARIAIDRRIAAESGPAAGEPGEMGGSGATRLATLLPLAKRAIQITIAVITVMITLSALGVDIGPLLAGAGVVGIAVGFGAQTLVRDVVSGAFFLMDDAFRVGEYVDVGSVKGTVEKISVRSFRLRHHRGPLHTVPFGEIQQLTNYSRDWVIMKLEFRVPFDTDPDQVRKIFKRIGQDLLANPELGPDFIEPFKSQGVFTLDDSALVIRGKFMAKPGKQFVARREIYNAVQRAFAAAGIRFADRRVTVQVADSNTLTPEERRQAVEAGAASAIAAAGQTPGGAAAADTR